MRNIQEYITEAWGNRKSEKAYLRELEEMLDKADKSTERRKKLMSGNNRSWSMGYSINPTKVLQKYPMSILIDKAGYTPEKIDKRSYKRKKDGSYESVNKTVDNLDAYGRWLYKTIKDGTISKEDLVSWWKEYDDEVSKSSWFDPSYVIKQVDPSKIWSIYYPESDDNIESIIKEPRFIFYYTNDNLRLWRLSEEEKAQVTNYYSDPVNQEFLSKEFSKLKKSLKKYKPTFRASAEKWIEDVLNSVKIDDETYDFERYFKSQRRERRYYQGSNDENRYGEAYYSLVMGVISDLYKINFYGHVDGDDDYDSTVKYSASMTGGDSNGDNYKKFTQEAGDLKITIKDLGVSEKSGDSTAVWSSSFSTFYRHDFKVIATLKDKEVYNKDVKNVVVASSYYSGGWD